jgi:hypothetical protein
MHLKVGHPTIDRSRVITQTERDTLVLQIGGWAWGWWSHLLKMLLSCNLKHIKLDNYLDKHKESEKVNKLLQSKNLFVNTWKILPLHRAGILKLLLEQLNKFKAGILALQEIRWTGEGILQKTN